MKANCVVCGEAIELYAQSDHLRFKHPAPNSDGFKFWLNGRAYFSQYPSMLVGELMKLADAPMTYIFDDESGYSYAHQNAVDLTHEPHFYCIPPATI